MSWGKVHRMRRNFPMQASYVLLFTLLTSILAMKAEVYMVVVEGDAVVHYNGGIPGLVATSHLFTQEGRSHHHKPHNRKAVDAYKVHLTEQHDILLQNSFPTEPYMKLYSYNHVLNGFAVHMTPEQADMLAKLPGVKWVEKNSRVKKATTHTPSFLGLPNGVWSREGGPSAAGEDVVIGIVDTGIDPKHPSFSATGLKPFGSIPRYTGKCEVAKDFPLGSCNGKIIGAQHFAAAATAEGAFNSSLHFASPLDGDGHGSHTASTAAGNHGVPVILNGYCYGNASGMAPRARIAVYKALYRLFGGFIADVVAAIDQAVADGVDILSLSLGPNSPPSSSNSTFLNVFDVALLSAVKSGVLVVQAAGNGGPYPRTILSFSPWIVSVAAGVDDRSYPNYIQLGNNVSLSGLGLAPPTRGQRLHTLILADDAVQSQSNPLSSPSDCQEPSIFNRALLQGKILLCTYSFNFVFGGATMQQVVSTVRNLSAAGFVMVVQSDVAGSKFDPIPMATPAIVVTSVQDSQALLDYYHNFTRRNAAGKALLFRAQAKIGNGQKAMFTGEPQQVALFSSRGPDIRDFSFQGADVLKPDIMAPGYLIWAAWSPLGIDEPEFQGKSFAMVSGTSMATPHVAGIAALLKEAHPSWSPAALSSALITTGDIADHHGVSLQAQQVSGVGAPILGAATSFDFGGGAVNPTAALDPGLIFDAGHDDYIRFLCSVQGVTPLSVYNTTGGTCSGAVGAKATDLNLASITITNLFGTRVVPRTVTNVANNIETYVASWTSPANVSLTVNPVSFTVGRMQSQSFTVILRATSTTDVTTFGEIVLKGSSGHSVRVPVSVMSKTVTSAS